MHSSPIRALGPRNEGPCNADSLSLGSRAPKDDRRRSSSDYVVRDLACASAWRLPASGKRKAEARRRGDPSSRLPALSAAPRPDNEGDPSALFAGARSPGTLRLAGARSNAMTRAPPPAGLRDAAFELPPPCSLLASPRRRRRGRRRSRDEPAPAPVFSSLLFSPLAVLLLICVSRIRFPMGSGRTASSSFFSLYLR